MMDPKLKAEWVAALRSGKYKQTKGLLNEPGVGHCCLGVLADIADPKGWRSYTTQVAIGTKPGGEPRIAYPYNGDAHTLTREARQRFGLEIEVVSLLARMNDGSQEFEGERKNFLQIADFIETSDI